MQTNGNTLLRFSITNQSRFPFEYVSFELPGINVPAVAPVASFISRYHYAVQNTYSDSLIKFTGLNTATYRYDQIDNFRYEVNTALLNAAGNEVVRIQVKAGDIISTVELNLKNCADRKNKTFPAELTLFKGAEAEQGIALTWQTTREENSAYFSIQHSLNGSQFEEIGQLKSRGISTSTQTYQFSHTEAAAGNNFYRLKQVDQEGKFSYSPVILVEIKATEKPKTGTFSVFPNPIVNKAFTITLENALQPNQTAQVILSDLQGKTVWEKQLKPEPDLQVNLSHERILPGVYVLKVETSGFQAIRKVIIQ